MSIKDYKIIKKNTIKNSLWYKIKIHARHSFYRLNATSSDCYAFDLIDNGADWIGGWDWSNDLIDNAKYLYMLDTNKLYIKNN